MSTLVLALQQTHAYPLLYLLIRKVQCQTEIAKNKSITHSPETITIKRTMLSEIIEFLEQQFNTFEAGEFLQKHIYAFGH